MIIYIHIYISIHIFIYVYVYVYIYIYMYIYVYIYIYIYVYIYDSPYKLLVDRRYSIQLIESVGMYSIKSTLTDSVNVAVDTSIHQPCVIHII